MQQAKATLIIEGGPLTPGILRILTGEDDNKLEDIFGRLEDLMHMIRFASQGAEGEWCDPDTTIKSLIRVLSHIDTSLSDISAIAGGFVTKKAA